MSPSGCSWMDSLLSFDFHIQSVVTLDACISHEPCVNCLAPGQHKTPPDTKLVPADYEFEIWVWHRYTSRSAVCTAVVYMLHNECMQWSTQGSQSGHMDVPFSLHYYTVRTLHIITFRYANTTREARLNGNWCISQLLWPYLSAREWQINHANRPQASGRPTHTHTIHFVAEFMEGQISTISVRQLFLLL